jgi:thiamine-phosphate pyrophosphorylase
LRVKAQLTGPLVELARELSHLTANTENSPEKRYLIINDRPDVALLAKADGVHLGQDDLPPKIVRQVLGDNAIIGLSTHNLEQVKRANAENIDYIGFGPIFPTTTKDNASQVVGTKLLADAVRCSRHPVVAIGGISFARLPDVITASPAAIAMISALYGAGNVAKNIAEAQRIGMKL